MSSELQEVDVNRFGVIALLFSTVAFSQTNNPVAKHERVLRIGVRSDVRFILTAPDGRSAGFDRNTGLATTQIPLSAPEETCSPGKSVGREAESCYRQIKIANPSPGIYRMQVVAAQGGQYGLYWSDTLQGDRSRHEYSKLPIATGELQIYDFVVGTQPANDAVRGDFAGNKAEGAADGLLTWGRPEAEQVKLPPGRTSYDLIVIYGATVIPGSFQVRLNDADVRTLFHPVAGNAEVVRLPLHPGSNILKTSVDGEVSGRTVTDTDTLEFTVR